MEPKEVAKHNARRQLLKVVEHIRESRQKLALAYDHLYLVAGVPQCKSHCQSFSDNVDILYEAVSKVFNDGVQLSHELRDLMENPNEKPPPIVGHFLAYTDMTPLQRSLIREGYEELARQSREHTPSHYYTGPLSDKPPKIIEPYPKDKRKHSKPKRNEMPL